MSKETQRASGAAMPEKTDKSAIPHLNIRNARDQLSQLVNALAETHRAVTLGRRKARSVVMVSFNRFQPLLNGTYESRLAFIVVENLLSYAPTHIRQPQIAELLKASKEDLKLLACVETLPTDQQNAQALREKFADPQLFDRLVKRHQIACSIAKAQSEGLYEIAEDRTSRMDLENGQNIVASFFEGSL